MKILTCAGYFSSGSSAVTDLFSEYEKVSAVGDYEFRFLHDIDGVSDLEFHLTECHNRHNSRSCRNAHLHSRNCRLQK